ncbi:MAG: hypothetical protein FWC34_11135 [Bacteroidetes bacterium]|nr:hypothetical protein [Bacteroidota bacterium]MCL2302904.1 hypothetical protein [Lentimicrobiaceae bacterium]
MTPKQQLNNDLEDGFKKLKGDNITDQVAKVITDAVDKYIVLKLKELEIL